MKTKLAFITMLFGASACGPDLNSPGKINVTGTWVSADTVATITAIRLRLTQAADGGITGDWTGTGSAANEYCFGRQCTLENIVIGGNTVVGIAIEILGGGKFTGQTTGNTMHGDLLRAEGDWRIKFTKAP